MPLHVKVLLGFALGAIIGLVIHAQGLEHTAFVESLIAWVTKPFGQIFLNLLFMLVVPLMFSALVLGVAELGDIASLGRLGWRTLLYTAAVTAIAVGIGLAMVNLMQPGIGFDQETLASVMASGAQRAKDIATAGSQLNGMQLLLGIVPKNIVAAAADDKQK